MAFADELAMSRAPAAKAGSRRQTGLEEFAAQTIELLRRSISADWVEMHVFGPDDEFISLGHRGVSARFHEAYHATCAWQQDPLFVPRQRDAQANIVELEEASERWGNIAQYRRFLQSFGLNDAAEIVFGDNERVLGGVSLIWTDATARDYRRDLRIAADMHDFLGFTFRDMWRRTRIGRHWRLARDHDLTAREIEVVEMLRCGLSNAEISKRLGISLATTKTHINNLFRKLGASTRTGALNILLSREELAEADCSYSRSWR